MEAGSSHFSRVQVGFGSVNYIYQPRYYVQGLEVDNSLLRDADLGVVLSLGSS